MIFPLWILFSSDFKLHRSQFILTWFEDQSTDWYPIIIFYVMEITIGLIWYEKRLAIKWYVWKMQIIHFRCLLKWKISLLILDIRWMCKKEPPRLWCKIYVAPSAILLWACRWMLVSAKLCITCDEQEQNSNGNPFLICYGRSMCHKICPGRDF